MMRVAIMQPTYLPWVGYFDLMDQVDLFVYLDHVQFVRQSWHQRNRIKTPTGLQWLTVPVAGRFGQSLQETPIADSAFPVKHVRAIEVNYHRASAFRDFFPSLKDALVAGAATRRLVELNIGCIDLVAGKLDVHTPRVRSSSLKVEGKRGELVLEICRRLGATDYVSPLGAAEYLLGDCDRFAAADVTVHFQSYEHPAYRQLFPPFVAYTSAVDLVLNERAAGEIMRAGRRPPLLPGERPPRMIPSAV